MQKVLGYVYGVKTTTLYETNTNSTTKEWKN